MNLSDLGFPEIHENPEWWIDKILNDLFFLCKVVLHHGKTVEYRDLNWIHKRLCDFLTKNPILQKLIIMFRDSLKSSIARALMIQWFLQKAIKREGGKGFIYSGIFDLAQDHGDKIIKEILGNEIIQTLFYKFIPSKRSEFDNIALDKGVVRYKGIEIDMGSPEKSLSGHHYEIGLIDNAVNEVNSQTQTGRKQIVRRWQEAEPLYIEKAREFIFETTWWPDDLSGVILEPEGNFDYSKIRRKPCLEFISEIGYAVFSCPARDENGKPVFPEKTDEEYLQRKKRKMGSHLYNRLYELQPTSDEDIQIRPEWIRKYKEDPTNVISNMVIDCAGTKAKESSYSAITIGEWNELGKLHMPFAQKRKLSPMELFDWVIQVYEWRESIGRPIRLIGIESEKYGIFLQDLVSVKRPKLPVALLEIESIPRPTRNSSVIVDFEQGEILIKDSPELKDCEDEIKTWYKTKETGVDIFDTFYYHKKIKIIPAPIKQNVFKPVVASDFEEQAKKELQPSQFMKHIASGF
jgi:hypothetical protein